MSVLTLTGKPINWAKPPKATDKVMWSKRTLSGKAVVGSLRTIAHLDHLNTLALKKFGIGIDVFQGPYNTDVEASKGTHDFDACLDVRITGVPWAAQQAFLRANGAGAYYRTPAQGFTPHIHYFTLPPREGVSVSDDYRVHGFKVGKYVDGGYSTFGRVVASSQIEDYYSHRTALSGHAHDPSWFPPNIDATIFDLPAYISRQRKALISSLVGPDELVHLNSHGPLARLGGDAGQALWDQWEGSIRARANAAVRSGRTVTITSDTNKRLGLPNFGTLMKRIGGVDIDLIAKRQATGGVKIKVIKRRVVDLHIDGHNGHGSKIKVTFPSGKTVTYWLVQANLGRGVGAAVFRDSCLALRKAFGTARAIYNFDEIDEADRPNEAAILREVFPAEQFRYVGGQTLSPTLVATKRLRVVRSDVFPASPGLAKVSPARVVVETVISPKK